MNNMKYTKEEQAAAKARLLEVVKPGDTIYTILRHRSSSGMSRVIDLKVIAKDTKESEPRIMHIGYNAAIVLGLSYDTDREGVKVGGCGMDMGFHLVYSLGSLLFGRGEERKKLNHHTGRNGDTGPETDGGYLLRHSWL